MLNENIEILSTEEHITTITHVKMIICGQEIFISVPHFRASEEQIIEGLNNRYVTEREKLGDGC